MATARPLALLALVLLALVGAAAAGDEYAVMHPDAARVAAWNAAYARAPPAETDTVRLRGVTVPNGSQDLLPYLDYVPSERNQGMAGNCWAWAGTGVLEVAHAVESGVRDRLSIEYLDANYLPAAGYRWAGDGGFLSDFTSFYTWTGMAVPWSNPNADYRDGGSWCAENGRSLVPAYAIGTDPQYRIAAIAPERIVTRHVGQEQAIANIKAVLDRDQAVWVAFYLPNATAWRAFYLFWGSGTENSTVWDPDPWVNAPYEEDGGGGGHAVVCVGYDDTDPENRYWVMLNSWGTRPGRPNGLFRVSMDLDYDATVDLFDQDAASLLWMTEEVEFAPAEVPTPRTIEALPCIISEPGRYILARDQVGLVAPTAIEVRAPDVHLNGSGHFVNAAPGTGQYGVLVYGPDGLANVTVTDLSLGGWSEGMAFFGVDGGAIEGCSVSGSGFAGVSLDGGTRNVSLERSTLARNGIGVYLHDARNTSIARNAIVESTSAGLCLYGSGGNLITDNRFGNTVNVRFVGPPLASTWNGPRTAGTNIVGGPFIGGNYWGAPDRTGWSDAHWDEDRDGIADGQYDVGGDGTNIDRLPLVNYVPPAPAVVPGGAGTPADLDGDGRCEDVNGNGRKDFADLTLFFTGMEWIAANEPLSLFDFNANGRIDFADVVRLFRLL